MAVRLVISPSIKDFSKSVLPITIYRIGKIRKVANPKPSGRHDGGAIATNNAGVAGIVESKSSKRKAEQGALADCKKRGGGDACKLVFSYHNQCAAVSSGRKGTMYSHAATEEIAVKNSLSKCEIEKGGDCHLYYSGCSLAERVQ